MQKPNLLFPTPVWTLELENFKPTNEEMYNYIKNEQSKDSSGINKSNIKGWHSKDFNLEDNEPKNFIKFISSYISSFMPENLNTTKSFAQVRLRKFKYSCIYYFYLLYIFIDIISIIKTNTLIYRCIL